MVRLHRKDRKDSKTPLGSNKNQRGRDGGPGRFEENPVVVPVGKNTGGKRGEYSLAVRNKGT